MKPVWIVILVGLAVSAAVDVVIGAGTPAYYAVFGLVGCVVIILASKWLGKALLQRSEDYYERGDRG